MSERIEEMTIDIAEPEEMADPKPAEEPVQAETTAAEEKAAGTPDLQEDSGKGEVSGAVSEEQSEISEADAVTEISERQDGADAEAVSEAEEPVGESSETADAEAEEVSADGDAEAPAAPAFDADAYLEQLAEAKRSITAGIVIYKGRINEKLQERTPEGYNALTSIINEPQYDRISQYDSELARFKTTGTIYQMEAGAEPVTIYDSIEYLDDYTIVYEQMMFFLRRMQFGLDYSDYMIWLQEWCLTVHFVVQMLQESELGEKGRVAVILADLYVENGQKNEAVYLLNMMMEQCGEDEKALLTERLEKLQES